MAEFPRSVRRAYVETYGCQMNIADGELMQGVLEADGYRIVSTPEEADVILVNTCAIREHAERRVIGRVTQLSHLKRERQDLVLGVTGCMAQRMGTALLEEVPSVDFVMGPDGYRSLPLQLRTLRGEASSPPLPAGSPELALGAPDPALRRPAGSGTFLIEESAKGRGRARPGRVQLAVLDLDPREDYAGLEQRRTAGVTAWVPIQRGCDHRCTFCIVPYVRGPEKNRAPADVLREVQGLAAQGVTELTLLGQTVNSYAAEGWSFPQLLQAVARIEGIRRVRFTSPHPNDVTEALIEVMATEPAVCEHLHLPIQSGSDRTLRRMARRYTVEELLRTVERVRQAVPDLALSTDVIAAFPGETDEEFEETVALLRQIRFDEAYTYRYSPREGTPATRLPEEDTVPDSIARDRLDILIRLTRGIQAEIQEGELGRVEEVLVERPGRFPGEMLGRTRRNKVVTFPAEAELVGRYLPVELRRSSGATFSGVWIEPAVSPAP